MLKRFHNATCFLSFKTQRAEAEVTHKRGAVLTSKAGRHPRVNAGRGRVMGDDQRRKWSAWRAECA